MYQFYVLEIQQYADSGYGHIVHYAWDDNADRAREKADSKYYEVLSAAAISTLPSHAVLLCSSEGFPLEHKCYKRTVTTEPEQTPTADDAAGEA